MSEQSKAQAAPNSALNQPVYIVDGLRTPFLKAKGMPGPFSASDLAVMAGRSLLSRQSFRPEDIDEVVVGCVNPSENEANIGRLVGLRLGCGKATPGWTVQRNCASGMQSIDSALKDISLGRADLVLAGGTEAMSHAQLIYNRKMVTWFAQMMRAKTVGNKLAMLPKLNIASLFTPIVALMKGLTDPLSGLNMGQTAEILAYRFNITRKDMDEFSVRSHARAVAGREQGHFNEITPLYDNKGKFYTEDDGVRTDCSMEKLAKLKPFFDRKFGMVTAANSSQITDGAAMLLLASEKAVKQHKLPVLAKISDVNWAALDPDVMGLGPVMAVTPMLQRNNLQMNDVDFWEINEAFAAQVIACVRAWESEDFCKEYLGLSSAFGKLDESRLNVDGGAVAMGHPVGASGARIVMHLVNVLRRKNAKRGVASICIGGGQGGAMLLETVE